LWERLQSGDVGGEGEFAISYSQGTTRVERRKLGVVATHHTLAIDGAIRRARGELSAGQLEKTSPGWVKRSTVGHALALL
jgi:hypothetical protein